VTDLTAEWDALWLHGDPVVGQLAAAGLTLPAREAGISGAQRFGESDVILGRPAATAPFRSVVLGPKASVEVLHATLTAAGLIAGSPEDVTALRILAGWPQMGSEILDRTLPQEVRFDEHDGVSYAKGCYTGQETVARLHFRGHTNRELRGLLWEEAPRADEQTMLSDDGRDAGVVTSRLRIGPQTVGLALVRREIPIESRVQAAGARARVVDLPFPPLPPA
jgi:folate-binding protein YgfZ